MSEEDFHKKHVEYSKLMHFPPFSISKNKTDEYRNDFLKEEDRIFSELETSKVWPARPFSTFEVKWDDDIEEARLYYKRYGGYNGRGDAQEAAIKLNNLTEDDTDVPRLA
jgi:hypothetical protein